MAHERGKKRHEPAEEERADDEAASGSPGGRSVEVPEILRRALALGFSGLFMTQETLRRALGDALPKDWVDFAVDQSDRTRVEMIDRLASEVGRVLDATDLVALAERLLEGRTIEVKAEIKLRERDEDSEDRLRVSVVDSGKTR